MNRKVFALVLIAVLIGISATACTRSATSKNPAASPTSEIPFPVGTLDTSARVTEIIEQTKAVQPTGISTVQTGSTSEATTIVAMTEAPTATPQPTATLPAIPTLERPSTYTLQKGEWPICIARRYNLDVGSLLAANNLSMNSQPAAGTVLAIPSSGTWSSGSRALLDHPTDYTTQSGDTIYSVACDFGDVSPEAIIAANSLQSPYTLTVGQSLRIP